MVVALLGGLPSCHTLQNSEQTVFRIMMPTRIRQTLFVLGLCILGGGVAIQLIRSAPHAAMLYLVGLGMVLIVLEPFMGLIVYLVFYYVKPQTLIPGFANTPVLLVIGAAAFVSMLISEDLREGREGVLKLPQSYFLTWFLLAIVVSHLSHGRLASALSFGYGFVHTIVIFGVITVTVSSVRRLNIALHCLGILTIWVAVQGLIVRYRGVGLGGFEATVDERVRVLGFTGDPNVLAAGLLLLIPLFYFEMARPGATGRRIYSGIALAVLCYVVLLTKSRGGALTLGIVGTMLLVRTVGLIRGLLLGLCFAGAIYFLGPSRIQELNPTEPSAFGRLLAWKRAIGEFRSSPLFGIGSSQSGLMTMEHVPHNAFMQVAAELGIFGMLPWVLLVFVSLKNLVFVRKRATLGDYGKLSPLCEALFYGSLAWTIALLFVGSPYYDELYIMLGLSVAAVNIFVHGSGSHYRLIERQDWVYAPLLMSLGLGLHVLALYAVGV